MLFRATARIGTLNCCGRGVSEDYRQEILDKLDELQKIIEELKNKNHF